jgi:hypothetical protein
MKNAYFRIFVQALVQTGAMLVFIDVLRWDIIASVIVSALIGAVAGLSLYLVQRRIGSSQK